MSLSDLTRTEELPLFMRLMDLMHDGVMVVDLKEVVVYVNDRFCDITGFNREELIGNIATEILLGQEVMPIMKEKVKERSQRISENYEIKITHKEGNGIWLRVSGSPILDVDNNVVGSIGLHTDITDKKLKDQQLKRALNEKELLLQETHHRVKNNLQVISSLMSLQLKKVETREDAMEAFVTCQKRIYAMSVIHDIVYDFGESGKINFKKYCEKLINHLCNALGTSEYNVIIEKSLEVDCMDVDDALTCGLLINELLANSIEHAFTEHGGVIKLSIVNKEDMIRFVFEDNGKGLPANFDINKGESLGLQLIKSFVERLDGQLEIQSCNGFKIGVTFPNAAELTPA